MFASVQANLTTHTVILDHSSHVRSVACQHDRLDITFADEAAYAFAKKSWSFVPDLTLARNSHACGVLAEQRSFWVVKALHCGFGLTLQAQVAPEQGLEDVLDGAKLA